MKVFRGRIFQEKDLMPGPIFPPFIVGGFRSNQEGF